MNLRSWNQNRQYSVLIMTEYVYGKVGNDSHYFVMDMAGELIGHENA